MRPMVRYITPGRNLPEGSGFFRFSFFLHVQLFVLCLLEDFDFSNMGNACDSGGSACTGFMLCYGVVFRPHLLYLFTTLARKAVEYAMNVALRYSSTAPIDYFPTHM